MNEMPLEVWVVWLGNFSYLLEVSQRNTDSILAFGTGHCVLPFVRAARGLTRRTYSRNKDCRPRDYLVITIALFLCCDDLIGRLFTIILAMMIT